ncbi:MAG: response regulator [Alphaproteobacteria bacterium]
MGAESPRVLLVDDDVNLLNAARRVLRKDLALECAAGAAEALKMLEAGESFAVLVSDQNMPGMKGVELLATVAERWPMTVRVMLTGNDDQGTAASAVNDGRIFRFVRKPCDPATLLAAIRDAAELHRLLAGEKQLLEQTLSGSVKVLTDILALTRPDIFQRATKVRRWARLVGPRLKVGRAWELDLAAMLYPLGIVALPESAAAKIAAGAPLSGEEKALLEQSPRAARDLIANIPRLEGVARAIYYSRRGFDGSGFPPEPVKSVDIPPMARLLHILIDLVDTEVGESKPLALVGEKLQAQARLYDPDMLKFVLAMLQAKARAGTEPGRTVMELEPYQLREGDTVARDIVDTTGRLLLAAGTELTVVTIQRLHGLAKIRHLTAKVVISRVKAAA